MLNEWFGRYIATVAELYLYKSDYDLLCFTGLGIEECSNGGLTLSRKLGYV